MTQTTTDTNDKFPPPEKEVRADLWATMTVGQLHRQQDLMVDKISKLQSMMSSGGTTASVIGLLKVMQLAMSDLTRLIESKTPQTQQKIRNV